MKKYFWIAAAVLIGLTTGSLAYAGEKPQQALQITELPSEEAHPASEDTAKALAESYYQALMAGDITTLDTILDAAADRSRVPEDVERYTSAAEALENLACYPLEGMREGEFFVFARYEMKFPGIQTTAPGLETVYVRPDTEGNLRLLTCRDFDQELMEETAEAVERTGIHILVGRIQEGFEEAKQSDPALAERISAILRERQEQTSGRTGRRTPAMAKTETADPETAENGAAPAGGRTENEGRTAYTTTRVKFRRRPAVDSSQDYYVLEAGVRVQILQTAGTDGEWYEVRLEDGRTGYIFGEYLSE